MNTKVNSVASAAAQLAEDPSVEARVKKEIQANSFVSALLDMRIAKGMTQEQIAESMGCDPSTISRIESGNDRQLKVNDLVGYTSALKVQMCIMFDDETWPAATRIKQCVYKIDEDLKKLADLAHQAGGDDKIAQGIDRFYRQVLFNFLIRFGENSDRLSKVIKISPKQRSVAWPSGDTCGQSDEVKPAAAPAEAEEAAAK